MFSAASYYLSQEDDIRWLKHWTDFRCDWIRKKKSLIHNITQCHRFKDRAEFCFVVLFGTLLQQVFLFILSASFLKIKVCLGAPWWLLAAQGSITWADRSEYYCKYYLINLKLQLDCRLHCALMLQVKSGVFISCCWRQKPQTQLCCSTQKCIFLTKTASFEGY